MRTLFICLLCAGLSFSAFASDDPYADPDWGYAYNDPHYIPDTAPAALQAFYDKMVPMMEARKSAESAYLREYADALFQTAREVPGSLENGTYHQRKHYNTAAHSLRANCKDLRELAHGGSTDALYWEMKQIEADFVKLSNLSDSR
jgi:hypothetical protein